MKAGRRIANTVGLSVVLLLLFTAAYLYLVRPWHRTWGATTSEAGQAMSGDELVRAPNYVTTRAVTINAPPERVWPWLVQMGYKRGGLYSYDWLDRMQKILDRPSATRTLPEFQNLKPGDEIPIGGGAGWPVAYLEANRSMVLDIKQPGIHITWSWALSPSAGESTRLVLRIQGNLEIKPLMIPIFAILDPGEFAMVRKMLKGIKQRVEGRPQSPTAELIELIFWAAAVLLGAVAFLAALFKRNWTGPYIMAWVAFGVLFYLVLGQPPVVVSGLLFVALVTGLTVALRPRRPGSNPRVAKNV